MRRLQAENPLVPKGIVREANVLDLEFLLSCFPFSRPCEMRFVELLTQPGNFDLVRNGKNNSKHGDPASFSDHHGQLIANRNNFSTGHGQRRKQDRHALPPTMLMAFFA
jgi:hypothetical protein